MTLDEISEAVFLPELKGSLAFDLARFPREHGLTASTYLGGPEDLKKHIQKGHPLITFLNLGNRFFQVGHFLVVIGYAEEGRWFITHSGGERAKPIPYERFLSAWEKMDYWTLWVRPKEHTDEL